ncbi:hypothetical protein [Diplocloster agilis]|uniref:hypothetical protein n=1 Tax=Diplocloster agilis TaxID=2850323 RepID=UPI0008228F40|nr:hypothetical protein [Suonthocola fibrivorans]MCU6733088.1 hypothetical protein [Suonthocola fibrivorans]SCI75039.1 4-hyroxy-2-oxovalerate/4-hydroxy-2-oxopentanoic acid aldolase%2C [uncultured Clostridium sp.]
MKKINVLDCTLRDGGYVNNWEFGYDHILQVRYQLEKAGVNIIELGFMRDEEYKRDRAIYNSTEQVKQIIGTKKSEIIYSALIEMANYYPLNMLNDRSPDGPDLMRYSFWMRCLDEAYDYAKLIVDKGYMLGVQPTRVEQYSDSQFAAMCERFSRLNPYAIYIVDTFGLLTKEQLVHYARIADEHVGDGIRIGYHAHNNMQQAFSNATTFIELGLKHDLVIDASVYGMGRGAGNLNLELIGNYLNGNESGRFDMTAITDIWDETLCEIYERLPWGYKLNYFTVASNQCNPDYARYYLNKYPKMKVGSLNKIIEKITGPDKYLFSIEKAEMFYQQYLNDNSGISK